MLTCLRPIYDAADMLLSTGGAGASGFQNDADGNTLSGNGRTNAWDSQNRLVSCIEGSEAMVKGKAALGGPTGRRPSLLPGGVIPTRED